MTDEKEIEHDLDFITDKYKIISVLGYGTFSICYNAIMISTGDEVAIKAIIRTTPPNRIIEELKILKQLDGKNYCIPLLDVLRKDDQIAIVFPRINNIDFRTFLKTATIEDTKKYMFCLLSAIKHLHTFGIIHRDIKPGNFLYDMDKGVGFLIDFGLTQNKNTIPTNKNKSTQMPVLFFNSIVKPSKPPGYYEKDTRPQMKANRAGTRGFRAPEILFKYLYQTEKIDCWSVGVILLCILTLQYPFFISTEDLDGLTELGTIFGHSEMRKIAKLFGRVWRSNIKTIPEDFVSLSELVNRLNQANFSDDSAIDLLSKLLELNPEKRFSADDALNHPFLKNTHT